MLLNPSVGKDWICIPNLSQIVHKYRITCLGVVTMPSCYGRFQMLALPFCAYHIMDIHVWTML